MGRTVIILPDDLEKRFKSEVFRRLGMKKGNITRAIQEAIELWIGKNVGLWEELISLGKYIDEMVKRKSIVVSKDTWERLMRLKVDMGKRKIEEVIEWLMEKSKTA